MSKKSSSRTSQTNWARLRAMQDSDIHATQEHPEADPAHLVRGIVRVGLKPVPRKKAISLRVDGDVLEWFRSQGTGWQTRMNAVLKAFKDAWEAETRGAIAIGRNNRTRRSRRAARRKRTAA